jgi:WD40 repeat protein
VVLWDAATGKELATLKGGDEMVNSVAFSPDGNLLAAGFWVDRMVKIWELNESK